MAHSRKTIQKIIILSIVSLLIVFFTNPVSTEAKSSLPYYIKVNKQQNCVTIYEKDERGEYTVPVKAMVCSVGADTPLGVFKTPVKYRWKLLMGDVWGQYSTRIVGGILFHSVWYYRMDASTLSATQYNKLGTTASHGCVRLTVEDAKWIYDNCPLGTSVEIYNGKDPGPLGKPEAIKLAAGTGWDPTDPNKDNPFLKKAPVLSGAKSKSVAWGSKVDLYQGIKAVSTTGLDISKSIKAEGSIDTYKPGKYKVTYSVSDVLGRKASKTVTITVNQCKEAPVLKGISDKVEGKDAVIDKAYALKGVSAYLSSKKLSAKDIKVAISFNENVYTIGYSIKAENNKTAKKTAYVYIDTTAPVIEGMAYRNITPEQLAAGEKGILKLAKENLSVYDDYSELSVKDIKITLEPIEDYAYTVYYDVSDSAGNTAREAVQYTCFGDISLEGIGNRYGIPSDTVMDDVYILSGVKAVNSDGTDSGSPITTGIWTEDNRTYEVSYSITQPDGRINTVTCYFYMEEGTEDTQTDALKDQDPQSMEDAGTVNQEPAAQP